jgi:glutathione peroxidase
MAIFLAYVFITTSNLKNVTLRQRILKAVYPAIIFFGNLSGSKASSHSNTKKMLPKTSIYQIPIILNNGNPFNLEALKGKKIMIVNTASNCGYTNQYEALQQLYTTYQDSLMIIGFPSNDFKEQEKGTDEEIAQFCKVNFGVTFPLAKKSEVLKTTSQNPVFKWLTNANENGWNDAAPIWNFNKYLIGKNGELLAVFEPGISPMSNEVTSKVKE